MNDDRETRIDLKIIKFVVCIICGLLIGRCIRETSTKPTVAPPAETPK